MRFLGKRGVSPVIATVLLIGLAAVLALVIFLWAKSTLAEQYLKFNEPVERSCESVNYEAEFTNGNFSVINRGNIPIYGFKVYSKTQSELRELKELKCLSSENVPITISTGESCTQAIDGDISGTVILVPQILAERGNQEVPYTCDKSFGEEFNVG